PPSFFRLPRGGGLLFRLRLGQQGGDRGEARDVDRLAVGHDRVERSAAAPIGLATGPRPEAGRVALAPVRVVDDVADHRGGAGDLAAVAEAPARGAAAGVERVEGSV